MAIGYGCRVIGVTADEAITVTGVMVDGVIMVIGGPGTGAMGDIIDSTPFRANEKRIQGNLYLLPARGGTRAKK